MLRIKLRSLIHTFEAPATTAGGRVLEKRYGLDLCRSKVTISFGPVVYPPRKFQNESYVLNLQLVSLELLPAAPPSALPKVELMMCTRFFFKSKYSSVPRPVFPKNPVAWHSSTKTRALYLSARSQMFLKRSDLASLRQISNLNLHLLQRSHVSVLFHTNEINWKLGTERKPFLVIAYHAENSVGDHQLESGV